MPLPIELQKFIQKKTNPSWEYLGLKLLLVQFFTSVLTLSLCPQWGIQFVSDFDGMRSLFMRLGHHWCELLCGSFYALSFFVSYKFIFSIFERRKLMSQFWVCQILILSGSLGFLMMWGFGQGYNLKLLVSEIHSLWVLGYLVVYIYLSNKQRDSLKILKTGI